MMLKSKTYMRSNWIVHGLVIWNAFKGGEGFKMSNHPLVQVLNVCDSVHYTAWSEDVGIFSQEGRPVWDEVIGSQV